MNSLIHAWLQQSALIFIALGGVAGVLAGMLLIFRPHSFQRLGAVLNRWVSTRNFDKALERRITLDPWFYRHRKANGVLTLLGALFVLYYFTVPLERSQVIEGILKRYPYPPQLVEALLDALVLSALLGALCAAFVALFILFRPSLLRDFEEQANQWVSLRRALKPLEIQRDGLERYVLRHTRQIGLFLLLGGLYILLLLLYWLSR